MPPDQDYFRTAIRMTMAAERLSHINDLLYVGSGARRPRRVTIALFRVP